jgi:hypothetical protein
VRHPDASILTCRPVNDMDMALLAVLAPGLPRPPIYPGSIQTMCQRCHIPVWMGPLMQQVAATSTAPTVTLCYLCAVRSAAYYAQRAGVSMEVIDLGNPYREP